MFEHHIISYQVISFNQVSYHGISYHGISFNQISYYGISYHVISYRGISNNIDVGFVCIDTGSNGVFRHRCSGYRHDRCKKNAWGKLPLYMVKATMTSKEKRFHNNFCACFSLLQISLNPCLSESF